MHRIMHIDLQCTGGVKDKLATSSPLQTILCDCLSHQDAFLWQDAVAPPSELLEEERDAEDKTGWLSMFAMKLAEAM